MNTDSLREDSLTLEILEFIERREDVSQRHLARQLGVALGLANSYLRRCVRKGYVKMTQAPANRYLYYLTPQGFTEKSRLTARYLNYSLSFYRQAGASCLGLLEHCENQGWRRLLLCGISDLAEIATLRAMECSITIIGYLDPGDQARRLLGRPVWTSLDTVDQPYDACMLTDLQTPQDTYLKLQNQLARERILVPAVLRLENRGSGASQTGTLPSRPYGI